MNTMALHQPTILRRYNLAFFSLAYLAGIVLATGILLMSIGAMVSNVMLRFAPIAEIALSSIAIVTTFILAIPIMMMLDRLEVRAL